MNRPSPKTRSFSRAHSFKALLALGTAFGSIAGGAQAQSVQLPQASDGKTVAHSPIGLDAGISRNGNTLNVQLRAGSTVIDWKGFNVPEGATADFRTAPLIGQAAVLNRDVSGARSNLLGNITSGDNVAVWIMNPSGILVGSKAAFSTGALVLTTLDVNETDFLNDRRGIGLSAPGTRTAGIEVVNGAQIRTADGTRGLVMVAPQIDANGTFNAGDGDVAFVTATDVTLNYNPGSPLSVTLNRGTSVAGRSQFVRGMVAGGDALFALASQATVTDALLQVDARVTTAQAGTRGIVLSAGRPASAVSGVATSSTAGEADGIASLLVNGALTTRDGNGGSDILAGANGTSSFTGALTTERDVTIASGAALSVTAAVTAGRDYTLTGAGVTLGRDPVAPATTPVAVLQQAGGAVRIRSDNGDIVGRAGLTLRSGTDGSDGITLTTAGTSAGNIAFATGSSLEAGRDRSGALGISLRDATNTLALGNVRADVLRGVVGTGPTGDRLTVATALTLGDVDVRRTLDITAGAGLTAGDLLSDRGVTLNVKGALTADTVRARGGSVTLGGSGDTTIATLLTAAGTNADVTVTRTGVLSLATVSATRDVALEAGAGSATVAGNVTAGRNYTVAGDAVTLGSASAVRQAADGDVRVTAGTGGITGADGLTLLANADASGTDALELAIDPARVAAGATGGTIAFARGSRIAGGEQGTSDVLIRSADANGVVTLGDVIARQLLGAVGTAASATGVTRTAAITVGDVVTRNDLVLSGTTVDVGALTSGSGDLRVTGTGATVTTGALTGSRDVIVSSGGTTSIGRVTAGGLVRVDAAGALTLGDGASAGGALSLAGGSVTLAGATYASGGAIDLRASAGGILGSGAVVLTSSSTRAGDYVRLQGIGADGIVLGDGSRIVAGANRALRVGVFNATAGAPLVLGDVSARSLGALAALDGDATQAAGAIVAAGDLAFARLNLVDSFAAESTAGNLSVGSIAVTGAGGGISLRAAGTLSVQRDVSASGDVTLASGTDLTLGTVQSRDARATVTSGAAARIDTLAGALGATLEGASITAREVRGGTVRAVAATGDATLGRIVGSAVTVSAAGLASLAGLDASGDAQITGGTVALSGTQATAGRYAATSTGGALTGAAGLSITADADGAGGEALLLSARGGGVTLNAASQLVGGAGGGSAVAITTDGAGVMLGRVRAASLTVTGAIGIDAAISTGDLTLGSDLSLVAANGVATGAIQAGDVAINGGAGDVATGVIRGNAVTLEGAAARFGAATLRSLVATARTGDVIGGDITASGAVQVSAAGDAALNRIGADSLSLSAGGVAGAGDLSIAGAVVLRGSGVRFGDVAVGSLSALAQAGDVSGGTITSAGAVQLGAGAGTLTTGAITADTLDASAVRVVLGDLSATTATLRAGALRFGDANVGSLSGIATTGELVAGAIDATGAVRLAATAGSVTTGDIRAGTLDASGMADVQLGDLRVTNAATLRAAALRFGNAAVGTLTATADAGNLTGGAISARGAVQLVASGGAVAVGDVAGTNLGLDAASATLGNLRIADAAILRAGTLRFGNAALGTLSAAADSGDVNGGDIDARSSVSVTATNGAATLGRVTTSGDLGVTAGTAVQLGAIDVGGAATLSGTAVRFVSARAGSFAATARAGDVVGGDVSAGSGIAVDAAAGAVTLGRVDARTSATVSAANALRLGDLSVAGDTVLGGGSVGFGAANVGALRVDALAGSVSGGDVTSAAGLSVQATGAIGLGRLGVAGDTALTAGGTIAMTALDGRGAATLLASGAGSDVVSSDGIAALGSVDVTAGGSIRAPFIRSAQGDLTVAAPTGDVSGFAPGSGIALSAGPGRAFTLRVGRAAVLGDIAGGSVRVEAPSVRVGSVDAGTGAVTLRATGGDLTVGGRVTGGTVTLGATQRAVLADVVASGALLVSGGAGGIGFTSLSGATIGVTSTGSVAGGTLRSVGDLGVSGGGVSFGSVTSAGGATVTASGGDLSIDTLAVGGDATLSASGTTRVNGAVQVTGGYRLTGTSITLGAAVQRASGDVRLTAGAGGVGGAAGLLLAGGRVLIDSAGALALADTRIETGGALGLRLTDGREVRLGSIKASSVGGFDGNAPTTTFEHDAAFTAEDVETGSLAVRLRAGDLRLGRVTSTGAVSLTTGTGRIVSGAINAGTLYLAGGGGGATTGALTIGGATTLTGASLNLGDVQSGTLAIDSTGAVTGIGGGAPALTTTAGDLSVTAGSMQLGTVRSAGAATLKGETISVAGRLAAARALLAEARAALTLGDASAADTLTLKGGGEVSTGALDAGGAVSIAGAGVTVASARSGGTIGVTSTGALSLANASTGAGITLDAAGLTTLGTLSGGPSVTVTADDAEVTGAIGASNVTFATRTPAITTLRVGGGTANDGFRLSAAELNRVTSDRLRLNAGSGALEVGTLALGAGTGGTVEMLSTGDVRVTGALSAAGTGRTIRVGGDDGDSTMANTIHIVATSDAGGRLLLADNNLELRGQRIAAGLAPGFIETLQPGQAGAAQAATLVGNANSALYNTQFGGGFFSPLANTVLSARSLTVRFGDYALFQNTGVPGTFAGVALGSTTLMMGGAPVLRVSSSGNPAQTSFALFGTINGVGGAGAALLGTNVVDIDPRLLPTSRINGCLAGSGAGCLTTIVIQPTLQVFNWNSADVFGISQDVSVPFQPIIGGNNEGLLTGLPELSPGGPGQIPLIALPPADAVVPVLSLPPIAEASRP